MPDCELLNFTVPVLGEFEQIELPVKVNTVGDATDVTLIVLVWLDEQLPNANVATMRYPLAAPRPVH